MRMIKKITGFKKIISLVLAIAIAAGMMLSPLDVVAATKYYDPKEYGLSPSGSAGWQCRVVIKGNKIKFTYRFYFLSYKAYWETYGSAKLTKNTIFLRGDEKEEERLVNLDSETPFDALESTIEETSAESSEETTVPIEETNEEEKKE